MEGELVKYLICYLLEERFHSEEELAEQMGIPHQELIYASAGQCDKQTAVRIASQILRYCISQNIPLDAFSCPVTLPDPSPREERCDASRARRSTGRMLAAVESE